MAPNPVGLTFGVGFLLVGAYMFGRGGLELVQVARAVSGGTTRVADLPGASGPVRLEGQARKAAATVAAPFSQTRCLAYEYEARERDSPEDDWRTLATGRKAVPFCVDDGTGRVRVEPADAHFAFPEEYHEVEPGEAPPNRVDQFLAETEGVSASDRTVDVSVTEPAVDARQRFVERRLEVDAPVTVFGESTPTRLDRADEGLVDAVVRAGAAMPLAVVVGDGREPGVLSMVRAPVARVAGGLALLALAGVLVGVLPSPV